MCDVNGLDGFSHPIPGFVVYDISLVWMGRWDHVSKATFASDVLFFSFLAILHS